MVQYIQAGFISSLFVSNSPNVPKSALSPANGGGFLVVDRAPMVPQPGSEMIKPATVMRVKSFVRIKSNFLKNFGYPSSPATLCPSTPVP